MNVHNVFMGTFPFLKTCFLYTIALYYLQSPMIENQSSYIYIYLYEIFFRAKHVLLVLKSFVNRTIKGQWIKHKINSFSMFTIIVTQILRNFLQNVYCVSMYYLPEQNSQIHDENPDDVNYWSRYNLGNLLVKSSRYGNNNIEYSFQCDGFIRYLLNVCKFAYWNKEKAWASRKIFLVSTFSDVTRIFLYST